MTNPLASAGTASPSVINVPGYQPDFGMIMQALIASKARKQRQAETALELVPQDTPFGELAPEAQKSLERATGRKWGPEEIVKHRPVGQELSDLKALMKGLQIDEKSDLGAGLLAAQAARTATGKPSDIATPGQLSVTQQTTAARGRTELARARGEEARLPTELATAVEKGEAGLSLARSAKTEAAAYESALGKLRAGITDLTPEETAVYRKVNDFVPSEAIAQQLGGQARGEAMKHAIRILGDPDSSALTKVLAPIGVSAADGIGLFALGFDNMLNTALSRQASIDVAKIQGTVAGQEYATKAVYGMAEEVSKGLKGLVTPDFIVKVARGDKKAAETPKGQMVLRFMQSGYDTALTKQGQEGDPGALMVKQLMELARNPQLANNPDLLAQVSNLVRESGLAGQTRTLTGMWRPTQPGPEQKTWDAINNALSRELGGMFQKMEKTILGVPLGWAGQTHYKLTPPGGASQPEQALPAAKQKGQADQKILSDAIDAIFAGQEGVFGSDVTKVAPQPGAGAAR